MASFIADNDLFESSIPQQRVSFSGKSFPLVLSSSTQNLEAFLEWNRSNRDTVDDLLRKHRAILFRDCGLNSVEDFQSAVECTGLAGMDYIGGGKLTSMDKRVDSFCLAVR